MEKVLVHPTDRHLHLIKETCLVGQGLRVIESSRTSGESGSPPDRVNCGVDKSCH